MKRLNLDSMDNYILTICDDYVIVAFLVHGKLHQYKIMAEEVMS